MQIHVLMRGGEIERASTDALKICDMADKLNGGGKNCDGPYRVVSVELEDFQKDNSSVKLWAEFSIPGYIEIKARQFAEDCAEKATFIIDDIGNIQIEIMGTKILVSPDDENEVKGS